MAISHLRLDSLPQVSGSQIHSASSLRFNLPQPPKRFFRHGWQSWTLTTWLDPQDPPTPVPAAEFRAKDEDPAYAFVKNHTAAWVGAVEMDDNDILLLGALGLGGRVELDGSTIKGFYECVAQDNISSHAWLIARGKEDEVFSNYVELLEKKFGKRRFEKAPRVWCSW